MRGQFPVHSRAINRIDLLFDRETMRSLGGVMRARMWRDASPPELMLEERRPLTAIAEEPLQTLYFAPERDAPGRLYLWEVALEGDEADGIALCADSQARTRSQSMALTWPKCLRMTGSTSTHVSPSCRAYVVYATEQALDDNSTISRLLSSDFDLRNIALIEQAGALPAQTVLPATPAQVLVDDNTRLVLSATAQVPALLVLPTSSTRGGASPSMGLSSLSYA